MKLPKEAIASLYKAGVTLMDGDSCDVFTNVSGGLSCLVCTTMAFREGEPVVLSVICNGNVESRKSLLEKLGRLISLTRLRMPKVSVSMGEGVTLLMTPWVFRGEFRAIIASAVSNFDKDEVTIDDFIPSKPDTAFLNISPKRLNDDLLAFASDYDTAFSKISRLAIRSKSRHSKSWNFPLECVISEEFSPEGMAWEMSFSDYEILERAHVLIDARIRSPKTKFLRVTSGIDLDSILTCMPGIHVYADQNSKDTRVEMARLVRFALTSIDSLDFSIPVADLAIDALMI